LPLPSPGSVRPSSLAAIREIDRRPSSPGANREADGVASAALVGRMVGDRDRVQLDQPALIGRFDLDHGTPGDELPRLAVRAAADDGAAAQGAGEGEHYLPSLSWASTRASARLLYSACSCSSASADMRDVISCCATSMHM